MRSSVERCANGELLLMGLQETKNTAKNKRVKFFKEIHLQFYRF